MDLTYFLKNNLALYSRGLQDATIKNWEFWRYQGNLDLYRQAAAPTEQEVID